MQSKKLFVILLLITSFVILIISSSIPPVNAQIPPDVQRLIDQGKIEQCEWRGTAPFCKGKCPREKGWVRFATSSTGGGKKCRTGSKALCCKLVQPN
ncbi:hypothetical protein Cylst_0034 [Cylindrospermum stagnale PCC 7417]|uniref:Uncharacterized protein n=1 Tax=Cylindrospermum stagnale PCC 7417 TaxID=56107 RepID=K9WS84_9NOST|nr:hypothetical protein Cylst_0034 [Cylindrospermum stagnale PCC 7417]